MNHFIFTFDILALVLLLFGISYLHRQQRFENVHLQKTSRLLILGIILLAVAVLIDIVQGLQIYMDINYFFQRLGMKLVDLAYVKEFAILPLSGISFLMAMIHLKKHL